MNGLKTNGKMSIIENKESVFYKNQGMHYSIEWLVKHLTFQKSPFHHLIIVTLIAFVAEAFVMNIISHLDPLSPWIKSLSDSTFLVILLSPALYFFLFRPMAQHIIERKQAEEAVQKANEELEERVEERTIELLKTSEELKQEIRERVEAEKALRESEARYRALFDNTIDGVAVYEVKNDGEDFVFIDLNEAGEKISDTPKDTVIGQNVLKMFSGAKDLGLFEVFQRVWRTGKPERHPVAHYKDDRIIQWVENSVFKLPSGEIVAVYSDETERVQAEEALRNAHDKLEGLVEERTVELVEANDGLKQEIEERRQAEETLRTSEERYRILTENVADGVGIIQDRKLQFANAALASILGYGVDQLVGIEPVALFPDDHKRRFREMFQKLEKGTPVESFQAPCIRGDGRKIWIEGRHNIIKLNGTPAILVTIRDITEAKLREIDIEEEKAYLQSENVKLRSSLKDRYKFGDIIGKSSAMQEIYELILKASTSDASAIIYGESGTGKDLIARTIHEMSGRREKPFVPVNCGAIPELLFESEFFGHKKGAFTGAHADKHGFFDFAHKGTLFLDEVGELTLNMQVKLLRAIEGGGYTAVGDNKTRKTDLRIIAATNKNLTDMVKRGLMREDFFYRIHIIPLTVPPLRERKDDIPLLVEHFLRAQGNGKKPVNIPGKIMEALNNYDWPGNVREIQNVLHRYFVVGHLDFLKPLHPSNVGQGDVLDKESIDDSLELQTAVVSFERAFIAKTLNTNGWNRSRASEKLGISRKTLFRKMKIFGLRMTQSG